MANTSVKCMLSTPPTNYHLLAAKQEPDQKTYHLTKHTEEFSRKNSGEWASRQKKKDKTERVTRLGRRTRDSKVESNDSPGVPDTGVTSDIPGHPSG